MLHAERSPCYFGAPEGCEFGVVSAGWHHCCGSRCPAGFDPLRQKCAQAASCGGSAVAGGYSRIAS